MIQCEGQMSLFELFEHQPKENIEKVGIGALFRYLRYGPHTMIPEAAQECKAYLDSTNGELPEDFIKVYRNPKKWKPLLPCRNCKYGRSGTCESGGHTCHYEYDVLICDGFEQTIQGNMPELLCDKCGYGISGGCNYPVTPDDYCVLGNKKIPQFKPGDWIEKENVGEQLTFDEITQMINQLIVMDMSTVSHEWYKVVMVEKIIMVENNTQRRLVYYDGVKQRGMVNEMYFDETMQFPSRAYRLKG